MHSVLSLRTGCDINPSHKIRTKALEYELDLVLPTLDLVPESSIFVRVCDGGFFERRCECLWSEGKTPTFANLMQ
jgi:hypothetical protein